MFFRIWLCKEQIDVPFEKWMRYNPEYTILKSVDGKFWSMNLSKEEIEELEEQHADH